MYFPELVFFSLVLYGNKTVVFVYLALNERIACFFKTNTRVPSILPLSKAESHRVRIKYFFIKHVKVYFYSIVMIKKSKIIFRNNGSRVFRRILLSVKCVCKMFLTVCFKHF